MSEQDEIITPGEIVFDDNSQETKSWPCLGQTRSRSSIEFSSQLFCFYWDRLKQSKRLGDEHTKSLYSPSVPIIFPQMQKPFSSVLSRRVYHVSLRVHSQSSRKKPENIRRHHVTNFQTKDRWRSLKGINWKQRREVLASEKGLQLMKVITAPVKKHLF